MLCFIIQYIVVELLVNKIHQLILFSAKATIFFPLPNIMLSALNVPCRVPLRNKTSFGQVSLQSQAEVENMLEKTHPPLWGYKLNS